MRKSKVLAFAISAISTGFLISCSKPAEDNTKADKDKPKAEPTNQATEGSTKSETTTESVKTPENSESSTKETPPAVTAIELPKDSTTAYLQHVSSDIIIPLYQTVAKQSKSLHDTAVKECGTGSLTEDQVKVLRAQWLTVAQAWAKAEAVNYGPAVENMANLYINYFPDERGLVHKSVKTLIADNPSLKPEQLVDESAIAQGIPALEDLLYSNDTLDEAQCNYLVVASAELSRRFSEIETEWTKNGKTLLDTNNPTTGMNQYFNGLLFHIENLKSTGIDKPLALTGKQKGHVPAHVSEESRAIVKVKLDILNEALTDNELTTLIGDSSDGKKVLEQIKTTITETEAQLSDLPNDISQADKAEQTQLHDNLTELTKQIKRGIMPLLSVQLGFNSTDGD